MASWPRKISMRTPLLLLGSAEFLGSYVSVLLSCAILDGRLPRFDLGFEFFSLRALVFTCVILACLTSMGLYHFHQRLYFREVLARVSVGILLSVLALSVIYYVFPAISLPKEAWAIAVLMSILILLVVRWVFFRQVDTNVFRRRTLVYGIGEKSTSIGNLRRRADRRGFIIVGNVQAIGDIPAGAQEDVIAHDRPLTEIANELDVDEIVIAMDDRRGNLPVRELLDCRNVGIDVIDLVDFLERESGRIPVELLNPSWLIFSEEFRTPPLRIVVKRFVDFTVSLVALLFVWPIMLFAAIAIKIEDGIRAPVYYSQVRVGYRGADFSIMKFRSMIVNAESDSGAVWAQQDDARITRVGHFLRKTRIDELPQIYNVLFGHMSIVGPRPERPEFVRDLEKSIPYYSERHTVRPGVTGWAQVNYSYGASEDDAREKLKLDMYYIKKHNVLLDFLIILQTVEVVLWNKGAR